MNPTDPRLLQLVQSQVVVGVPLPFGVRDAQGTLLLAKGQIINDEAHLAALFDRGMYADADEVQRAHQQPLATSAAASTRRLTLIDRWEQLIGQLEAVLRSATEPGLPDRVAVLSAALLALQRRDADIGIYMAMRQDPKRLATYGLSHSIYTAMGCGLAAGRLGWSNTDTSRIVSAALTMNLSIIELQGRLAMQCGKPTTTQLAQLRAHPEVAAASLAAAGISDSLWLETVAQHHERPDGAGYPQGLSAPAELATALRLADVLLAKISPRADRAPLPIQQAHRDLFADGGSAPFATALIKEFGIYPPGDFVRLKSGELAVVVRRGANAMQPEAAAITDRNGTPIVAAPRRDTSRPEFAIVGPMLDKRLVLRVPPERFYGLPE